MLSSVNWWEPQGVKADPKANVKLGDLVHAFDRTTGYGSVGWSGNKTACQKSFKHHDELKNRRTDEQVNCVLCLVAELEA